MSTPAVQMSPQLAGIVSRDVLKSLGAQEGYFVISSDEMSEHEGDETIVVSTTANTHWTVANNVQACVIAKLSDLDLLSQMAAGLQAISAEIERMSDYENFQKLSAEWKRSRAGWQSFSGDLMRDPSYSQIVGMGPAAIPFMLSDFESELSSDEPITDWFYALWAITRENPIPLESQGRPREAARAWIEWGKREGHVNAGMGIGIPEFR